MPGTKTRRELPPGLEAIYKSSLAIHKAAASLRVSLDQDALDGEIERAVVGLRACFPRLYPALQWPDGQWTREEALRRARDIELDSEALLEGLEEAHPTVSDRLLVGFYQVLLANVAGLHQIERSAA